jgi:hypothetical protein
MSEATRQPELMKAFRERVAFPRRDLVKRLLRRGIDRGDVRANLDLEQAADAFMGNVLGRHVAGLPFDDRWLESAIEFFWRGIRAEPSAGARARAAAGITA